MYSKEIEDRLRAVLVDGLHVCPEDVTLEASFTNDLGADSLVLNIIVMYSKEIEDRLRAIVVDGLHVCPEDVTLEASFTNDLGADSLDIVELVMEAEKAFGITIADAMYEGKSLTFGNVLEIIEDVIAKKPKKE